MLIIFFPLSYILLFASSLSLFLFLPKAVKLRHILIINYLGSIWTKIYKPVEVCEIIPNCDIYEEDKYTIKYNNTYAFFLIKLIYNIYYI